MQSDNPPPPPNFTERKELKYKKKILVQKDIQSTKFKWFCRIRGNKIFLILA